MVEPQQMHRLEKILGLHWLRVIVVWMRSHWCKNMAATCGGFQREFRKELLAIRCIFSLVVMITNTKFSNCPNVFKRTSDGGNGNHSVSLPIILLKIKVDKMLASSYISSLLVSILWFCILFPISINVRLYFGAKMVTFCIIHIGNRKKYF